MTSEFIIESAKHRHQVGQLFCVNKFRLDMEHTRRQYIYRMCVISLITYKKIALLKSASITVRRHKDNTMQLLTNELDFVNTVILTIKRNESVDLRIGLFSPFTRSMLRCYLSSIPSFKHLPRSLLQFLSFRINSTIYTGKVM